MRLPARRAAATTTNLCVSHRALTWLMPCGTSSCHSPRGPGPGLGSPKVGDLDVYVTARYDHISLLWLSRFWSSAVEFRVAAFVYGCRFSSVNNFRDKLSCSWWNNFEGRSLDSVFADGWSRRGLILCVLCQHVNIAKGIPLTKLGVTETPALPLVDVNLEREELHTQPYDTICWRKVRHLCAKEDLYYPHHLVQDLIWNSLHIFTEPFLNCWPFNKLRERALQVTLKHIHYEDENSRYITIGCVERVLCMLACWVEDPDSDYFKKHLARIPDYLWVAEDGMKMQSFGSQEWDAGVTIQALLASNMTEEIAPVLARGHDFIKKSQVKENPSVDFKYMYHRISKGSWTLSDQDHGWQVSDCTAEALKCCLLFSMTPPEIVGDKMEPGRLYDAVNILLSQQSKNGRLAAWEPAGAQDWLEELVSSSQKGGDSGFYIKCCTVSGEHAKARRVMVRVLGSLFYIRLMVCAWKTSSCWQDIYQLSSYAQWSHLSSTNTVAEWQEYIPLEEKRSNLVHTAWAMMGLIHAGRAEGSNSPAPGCEAANQFTNGRQRLSPTGNHWGFLQELHVTLCRLQEHIPIVGSCRVLSAGCFTVERPLKKQGISSQLTEKT